MNWGKGLALALIAFAGMMTWFVIKASQHPSPLVTEDYYRAELKFQGRIDATERANALSAPVSMDLQRNAIALTFPAEMHDRTISGTLSLLRPNTPAADRNFPFKTATTVFRLDEVDLLPGRYNAAMEWQVDGVVYHVEDKVNVP